MAPVCQQVYQLGGICKLVDLLRSPNQNVQQAAAGALRNLVFRSITNKLETRRQNGIREAVNLLRRTGSTEIQKQLTGRDPQPWRARVGVGWCIGHSLQSGPKHRCTFDLQLMSWEPHGTDCGQVSGVHMVPTHKVSALLKIEGKG